MVKKLVVNKVFSDSEMKEMEGTWIDEFSKESLDAIIYVRFQYLCIFLRFQYHYPQFCFTGAIGGVSR